MRCTRGKALLLKRGPGIGDALAQGLFGAGGWVPGDYIEAVGKGAGDPAAADDATAKRGKILISVMKGMFDS